MGLSRTTRRLPACPALWLPLFLVLTLLAVALSPVDGADYKVLQGIVQRVSGQHVTMGSSEFDVAGARVVSPSGAEIPFSEVAPGKKVSLFLKGARITTVVVYPADMVE